MPGMTVCPLKSIVLAPCGTVTLDVAPTAAIFPSRIRIVWLGLGAAPVPSMTVAFVSATTGSLTVTKSRVVFDNALTDCAAAGDASTDKVKTARTRRMKAPVGVCRDSFDAETHHHSAREVFGDVTV